MSSSLLPAPKRRIHFSKTLARVAFLFKNPEEIKPDALPVHLAAVMAPTYSFKLPQLKGNVFQTLKEIVAIFIRNWTTADRAINIAIRTTRTSLAKRCGNLDASTAYRHILTLIEHGFLRAKVQVKGGLQLLINPDLFVFEGGNALSAPVAARTAMSPPAAASKALGGIAGGLASLLDIGNFLSQKFSQNTVRRT
jgi:hypothetical protein